MGTFDEMIWIIKLFLGKKYFIKYADKLKNGEILVIGHKIYISKEVIKNDKYRTKRKSSRYSKKL